MPRVLDTCSDLGKFEIASIENLIGKDEALQRYSKSVLKHIAAVHQARIKETLADAEERAAHMLKSSRAEADRLLREIESDAERKAAAKLVEIFEAARKEAEKMKADARNEVLNSYKAVLRTLNSASEAVADARAEHLASVEEEVVTLVGRICRHLVRREFSLDSTIVARIVASSLEYFDSQASLIVKIAPSHHRILTADPLFADHVSDLGLGAGRIEFVPDAKVSEGSVVVTDRFVTFDYNIDDMIESAILDAEALVSRKTGSDDEEMLSEQDGME